MKVPKMLIGGGALISISALGIGMAGAGHLNALLEGDLTGRQEVRSDATDRRTAGDPDGRGEAYVFGIDNDAFTVDGTTTTIDNADTLCYILIVDGIAELDQAPGNGRAAHIHRGAAGENGPVVANLAWPQDGQASDCLTEGENGKGMTAGIVQEILGNPEGFYVNIHNGEYPGGAVRAQLAAQGHGH